MALSIMLLGTGSLKFNWGDNLAVEFEVEAREGEIVFVGSDLEDSVIKGFGKEELAKLVAFGGANGLAVF